jgi:DNA-binding NtrC family response regulator
MKCSDFTVLFADDNEDIKKVYEKSFVKEGYKVVLAEHGARVLAELGEQKIDLLVTDLEMAGMNTFELFPILKKDHPQLPVIVVTGHYVNLEADFKAKGFEVNSVFIKPFAVGILKEKIREILKIEASIPPL